MVLTRLKSRLRRWRNRVSGVVLVWWLRVRVSRWCKSREIVLSLLLLVFWDVWVWVYGVSVGGRVVGWGREWGMRVWYWREWPEKGRRRRRMAEIMVTMVVVVGNEKWDVKVLVV